MGLFGGDSSSNSYSTNTTIATDKRMVIDNGLGVTSDSSTVNVTTLDAGLVGKALETVSAADAVAGDGFARLLGLADKLFSSAGQSLDTVQAGALAQVGALKSAVNDASGKLDQKTIVMLAAAAVAVFYFMRKG